MDERFYGNSPFTCECGYKTEDELAFAIHLKEHGEALTKGDE